MKSVFVFGSNEKGIHGAGAAKDAFKMYGAEWGKGFGLAGQSFAIPTKDGKLRTLTPLAILTYVELFREFARQNPQMFFEVTPIGTGLAGLSHRQMAPMFLGCPNNVLLPYQWRNMILRLEDEAKRRKIEMSKFSEMIVVITELLEKYGVENVAKALQAADPDLETVLFIKEGMVSVDGTELMSLNEETFEPLDEAIKAAQEFIDDNLTDEVEVSSGGVEVVEEIEFEVPVN